VIHVLQDWETVEAATQDLQNRGLPTHITIQKNWDQWLLYQLLHGWDRQAKILDLGCGDCCTLDFLAALGFKHLYGIDLTIKPQISDRVNPSHKDLPYQLFAGDMTATSFPACSFDIAVSISVIEHGVDLNAFFREAQRLLKAGGILFVTTDYWQHKLSVDASIQPFGLSWSIFSKPEIQTAIALANQHGFVLEQNLNIPACVETPVSWYERDYTFIAIVFKKQ
jgi:2-polyprenyl-3-methyl-5-hydroxy-6-metoxy-1,4-benzoquinol methylase